MRMTHPQGREAEDKACQYLQKKGYRIIERNWHCPFGEIDVIAKKTGVILFVEVKYRSNHLFGGVAYSIHAAKLAKISKSVQMYLQQHPTTDAIRVDAILIEGNAPLRHIENILG